MRPKLKKLKLKISYFSYSIFLITLLSLITLFVTILSPIIDGRLIATSLLYVFLSVTFLLSVALFSNQEKIHPNFNKILFIVLTLAYSLAYIWASFSYLFTNQIIRKQSIFFIYQIFPKTTVFLALVSLFLVLASIILIMKRKIHLLRIGKKRSRKMKSIILTSSFLLIFFMFILPPLFQIFNPLVELQNQGKTVFITTEKIESEKILNVKTNLTEPNVIFILLESVSSERLGSYGYERDVTPNIDFLAENGIVFHNAYSTATHSDYAQPAYLSSRYMISNEYRNFFDKKHKRKNIWEFFDELDYTTGYISSQDDLWAEMNEYFNFESLDKYSYSLSDGKTDYGSGLAKKDYDDKTMDEILVWLDEISEDDPFFLYTNLQATHTPMSYEKEYSFYKPDRIISLGLFNLNSIDTTINRYDNSLRYVDLQVGRLINSLREKGVLNNTVIVLSADHGHDFHKRHNVEGHGLSIYNEELNVPLIFYFPDLEPQRIESHVSHIDVLPTVVDILGKDVPKEWIGEPMKYENRIFFYSQNHRHLLGMLHNNIKIIIDLNKKTVQAYDLSNDPGEEKNIVNDGFYDEMILELLLWNHCQKNYFSEEKKNEELKKYCENF
jgi:arylsulfatase A-like enzyme